ncbi:MAG TPA: hypothetical protein PLU50_04930, partial [Pseudobdellovibrionaceae bacterium]|nr:hypothetical protein [Pseudobdellovibrionaceae bacterium]
MKLLMQSFVNTFQFQNRSPERAAQPSGRVILLPQATEKKLKTLLESEALPWVDVKASLAKPFLYLQTQKGPLWVVSCHDRKKQFTFWRDSAGDLVSQWQVHGLQSVEIDASQLSGDQLRAVAMGFELASYNYRVVEGTRKANLPAVSINIQKNAKNNLQWELGRDLGMGMNVGRHLINHPGNILNPVSYSEGVKNYFQKLAGVKVTVLKGKDLDAGRFGLLQAVGAGSPNPPCLVHISYRPKLTGKLAKGAEPIAFVGKGITFDTGGLDIKISSSMRLMKKDMGGSASVIGLADFVIRSKLEIPCDFIIALAENSVDGLAMRPGDIIRSKSGQ